MIFVLTLTAFYSTLCVRTVLQWSCTVIMRTTVLTVRTHEPIVQYCTVQYVRSPAHRGKPLQYGPARFYGTK